MRVRALGGRLSCRVSFDPFAICPMSWRMLPNGRRVAESAIHAHQPKNLSANCERLPY
jgi:hypothetical protein